MKKPVFLLTLAVVLAACNNAATNPSAAASAKDSAISTAAKDKATGCAVLSWFRKGTALEYSLRDGNGKEESTTVTTIEDVRQDGNTLVADYSTTYGKKGNKVNSTYRCEGNKIHMDMKSMMGDMFSAFKQSGVEIEVKDAYVTLPWDMKPGDNLDDASMEILSKKDGKDFMKMTSVVKDRKVEGLEKITTPAGTWDCIRMSETRSTTTEMMGRKVSAMDVRSVQWFSPETGLVKYESYNDKGTLTHTSELISIKSL